MIRSKAKNRYQDGETEGYCLRGNHDGSDRIFIMNWFMPNTVEQDNGYVEIDPSTLKHSFDGVNWYSEGEIKEALEVNTKDVLCENCTEFKTPEFGFSVCEKIGNVTVPKDFCCNRHEPK